MHWDTGVREILSDSVLIHQCRPKQDPETGELIKDPTSERLIYEALDLPAEPTTN